MITLLVNGKGGPMLSTLNGCLVGRGGGKSGVETNSYIGRFA